MMSGAVKKYNVQNYSTSVISKLGYWKYPAFTWPWFVKRSRFFNLLALAAAIITFLEIGTTTANWSLAGFNASILLAAYALKATVGPLPATFIGQRHWPINIKRVTIVIAVLLGVAVCTIAQRILVSYYVERVIPTLVASGYMGQAAATPYKSKTFLLFAYSFDLLVHWFLSGGFALRNYFAELRTTERVKQQQEIKQLKLAKHEVDMQLSVLQAQIEPHFLFNTLASVRSLVTQDQARAAKMIEGLSDYLRITLPKLRDANTNSTLGEQLAICSSYLELMRLRMGERFSFSIDVTDELRNFPLPPLLLLPLVENAVTHGVEPKVGVAAIHISADQQGEGDAETLQIEISDDGVGLGAAVARTSGQGVGLANVRTQLQLRFGQRAQLEVFSRPDGGTIAVMRVPRTSDQEPLHNRQNNFWFPEKRIGFGWGAPVKWQGWVVLGGYLLAVLFGTIHFSARSTRVGFSVYLAILTGALLALIVWKGERTRHKR